MVYVLAPDGKRITSFGGQGTGNGKFSDPVDIAVNNNEVYVLDTKTGSIKVFNLNGKYLRDFGSEGTDRGSFRKPSSIAVIDDMRFLVSDTENSSVKKLATVYTPTAPSKLKATGKMREIRLSWSKRLESYVESYKVFRSEKKKSGFKEIASIKGTKYKDMGVEPFRKYYYKVCSVAREGNESMLGVSAEAMAKKFKTTPPIGLKAQPHEWSVELTWLDNNEDFLLHYIVYRKGAGGFKEIGKTKTPSFTDAGLDSETTYYYKVSSVSTDNLESEAAPLKTVTHIATRPPLEIEVVKMHDIFSNTYKIYENEGIGSIKINNNTRNHISKLRVSFTILEFMDFASEVDVVNLPPRQSQEFTLKAVFNNRILNVTEDTPVQTEIKVSYYENAKLKTYTKNHTVNIYEKHRMMWDVRKRFASFITPKDAVVLDFSRSVVTQYKDANAPIIKAAALFDSLGLLGLKYMADPSNPYQETSGKTDFVDYIQYPRETLERKSGDCDDLVGLYAASLESLGVHTLVLEVPGHMLMMFSTGIESGGDNYTMNNMLVIHNGLLWIPVETTLVGNSFMKAWEAGSDTYYKWSDKELTVLDIRNAWNKFKPASLQMTDWRPPVIKKAAIDKKFNDEFKTLKKIKVRLRCKKYVDILKKDPNNVNALNQVGIIYALEGDPAKSLKAFNKVLSNDPKNAAATNNMGNVSYMEGKYEEAASYYEKATEIESEDPYVWVNLSRCYLRLDMDDKATEAFNKAVELKPEVQKNYRGLSIKVDNIL
jgi:hypothetical protein